MDKSLSTGAKVGLVFSEARRIAMAAPEFTFGYVLLLSAAAILVDIFEPEGTGHILISIVSFAATYFMTRAFLQRSGLVSTGLIGGFGIYFSVSLLSGLATMIGLLLFVIPGLFLMVRWLPAYAVALLDDEGATDALAEAWSTTEGHTAPLAIAIMVPALMYAVGMAALFVGMEDNGTISPLLSAISNVLVFSANVVFTALGIATCALLRDRDRHLENVFV